MTVADTGGGIPAEHMDKLFRPFYTTKPPGKGTGLGLSICYGIISDARGQISISNDQGGAIVEILLPEAEPANKLARG
jgi:C4-dicarboxylate-specific signal transduction histidine kinase